MDKLVAGLVTFGAILPLCAICVLGVAAISGMLTGAGAWLGGAGGLLAFGLAILVGLLVYRTVRRNRAECDREASACAEQPDPSHRHADGF